jgi:hypothetical protein
MDPNGNDINPGTYSQPVKSFSTAIQKLPFGVAGVNGGNAYGLIMLKPGFYETTTGFQQYVNGWKNGNVYKNISVEGIGEVIIGGTQNSFATGHLLVLSGDHIFIKNLKIRYSTGIGILLNRADLSSPRQRNILIENVVVDSVGSFSMLLRNIDTVLVRNSVSLYSSRPGNHHLTSPCQWPSGIKFFNSHDCIIHDSEIAYSRGEGLNFHNSLRGKAYRNKLHDNGLNFYNDNSAKLQVHHNFIYNTPDIDTQYWRNCPSDTNPVWAPTGMLIANEGACDMGSMPVFEACSLKCSFPSEVFSTVDSMFVYNNVFQNVGRAIGFWQGVTDIPSVNCIKNVHIFNNTFIGTMAMPGASGNGFVNVFYPSYNAFANSYYGTLKNVRVTNNIFTFDTVSFSNLKSVNKTIHAFHPGPVDITFDHNLWVKYHSFMGANDLLRPAMLKSTYLLTDSLNSIVPCAQNQSLVHNATAPFSFLTDDYHNRPRNATSTNVGALEFNSSCISIGIENLVENKKKLKVFPNPCFNCTNITINDLPESDRSTYFIYTTMGSLKATGMIKGNVIELNETLHGMYLLVIQNESGQFVEKLIIKRN